MTRDPLIIVFTLSLAGLAFFLLIEHVPKWVRLLASSKPFDGIRTALTPIALPGWIKALGVLAWSALLVTLLAGMFFVILSGLAKLPGITPDTAPDLRWYLLTLTAITAALGAIIALPFTLRRTVQNERQTRTAEEGYITQQINEAVANLAAQKEVNKVGRVISYQPTDPDERWFTTYETVDDRHRVAPEIDGSTIKKSAWEPVKITEPNIEVRIGAILALERLARQRAEAAVAEKDASVEANRTDDGILNHDAARDHVRIMEILCAYIRENATAKAARALELSPWPELEADGQPSDIVDYRTLCTEHRNIWRSETVNWTARHTGPRSDIQTVLNVLGRRTDAQRNCEGIEAMQTKSVRENSIEVPDWYGFRIDLRRTDLQLADFSHSPDRPMYFAHARLTGARMQGAVLDEAFFAGVDLRSAHMQATSIDGTHLQNADLSEANMQGAMIENAKMHGTELRFAHLHGISIGFSELTGADLTGAQMNGANLGEVGLQNANLLEAELPGAFFWNARLQGATFEGARLQVVEVHSAEISASTNLKLATLKGAGIQSVTFRPEQIEPELLTECFGDASVNLEGDWPSRYVPTDRAGRLSHWSSQVLRGDEFKKLWREFRESLVKKSKTPAD